MLIAKKILCRVEKERKERRFQIIFYNLFHNKIGLVVASVTRISVVSHGVGFWQCQRVSWRATDHSGFYAEPPLVI